MRIRLLLPLLCCSSYEVMNSRFIGNKMLSKTSPLHRRRRRSFFLPPVILATYHYWRCPARETLSSISQAKRRQMCTATRARTRIAEANSLEVLVAGSDSKSETKLTVVTL